MGKGPTYTRYTGMGDIAHRIATTGQQALAWFKSMIQKMTGTKLLQELKEDDFKSQEQAIEHAIEQKLLKPMEHMNIGQLFLFKYDPKWKNRLQYWDVFPLCIPIGTFSGGFIGINLHYLPSGFRAPILFQLGTMLNDNNKYDDEGRLDISYDILKNNTLMFQRFYKDCVRKYLYAQVRSQFQYVSQKDWSYVAVLPFERWEYKK